MNFKFVDLYYFSGTGNTLTVVDKIKETFESSGIEVKLYPIEKVKEVKIDSTHLLGLAFPVAMQGTYPFVWSFLKKLPKVEGVRVFMVDTLESFSGGIIGPVKVLLDKKGYKTIGAKEIKMPSNLLPKTINTEKNIRIKQRALIEAENYATCLISGKASWKRVPLFSDLMSIVSKSNFVWKILRKIFLVNTDRSLCEKCGICSKLCPNENISFQEYPVFGDKCVFCMRCVSFCPTQAIYVKSFGKKLNFERYRAVGMERFTKIE